MKATITEIASMLIEKLWNQYVRRVPYAQKYADLVKGKGGKVVHDHIAFRTFNAHSGEQPEGITAVSHIIRMLGYKKVESYKFPKMKLNASHFEHADPVFPKIFISQLELEEFPEWVKISVGELLGETPYLISDEGIELLNLLRTEELLPIEAAEVLVNELVGYFRRPWGIPKKDAILRLNDVSQYAAWTLLHGNSVNHFAAFVNFQEVKEWPDIEATYFGLQNEGIPLKKEIEGEKGSKLRQTATQAVKESVEIIDDEGNTEFMNWTYAYFELTERGYVTENGLQKLFSGFLGEQAVHLFDMTRTRDN